MPSLTLLLFCPAEAADLAVGPSQPYATLEDAVDAAVSGDRVLVDPGTYAVRGIDVGSRVLEVRAAAGAGTVVIEVTQDASLFEVSGGDLTLVDLEVDGGGQHRLAQVSNGTLTVEGCTVHDVTVPNPGRAGGAIDAVDSTVNIRLSTFTTGSAPVKPGGLLALDSSVGDVFASRFEAGSGRNGGAISAEAGSLLHVEGSTFAGNTAGSGAAIEAIDSDVEIVGSVFSANTGANGVVRCARGVTCLVEDSWFEGNGAAALLVEGTADSWLLGTTVCQTTAPSAVDLRATAGRVQGSVFLLNSGRALQVDSLATAEVTNNHLVATTGEALWVEGQATLVNTLIAYNTAVGAVVTAGTGSLTSDYNLYYGNAAADLDVAGGASDILKQDPLITVPKACDIDPLRLGKGSPAVDAGDPAVLDADGTRSDIGAFGGGQDGPPTDLTDADGDGWSVPADCDDGDAAIHPGAPEQPCNGVDEDCRGDTPDVPDEDEDGVSVCDGDCLDTDPYRTDLYTVYRDDDRDGFGRGEPTEVCGLPLNASDVGGDCDDFDPDVYPGAVEVPHDGVDQDCDGSDIVDADGDGASPPEDCDDADPDRFAGNTEVPDDGIDQDCTGSDATAILTGAWGLRCGCQGAPGPGWAAWLALVVFSRRRSAAPRARRAD